MNYVLQVVRGRSATTTLKLADGVTSIGRHDDCLIRIKSSQVSRRHCELLEDGDKLTIRDLGSSNGTFVNGKRVLGQQRLKHGDELTVGAVTLRVAKLGQAVHRAGRHAPSPRPATPPWSRPSPTTSERRRIRDGIRRRDDPRRKSKGIPLADDTRRRRRRARPRPRATAKQAHATPAARARARRKEDDASHSSGRRARTMTRVPRSSCSRPQARRRGMIVRGRLSTSDV